MKYFLTALFALLLITMQPAYSASVTDEDQVASLRKALKKRLPSLRIDNISVTPIKGLYQVVVGSQVVYMDVNAEYMIDGDLVSLKTKKNYSEQAKSKIRLDALSNLGEKNMLIYKPEKSDFVLTVVSDIDCPYCRRLHSEIQEYLDNNVEVRYLFMPLKGENDRKKTISVWCADDPHLALDVAKAGGDVETSTCDNPIDQQMKTGRKLGVTGTPAIILEDGEMLPGYVPANKLIAELRRRANDKTKK